MERLEIKDFVGIRDITIEIKQINILIGPQASGKSVVAKLLFYFRSFISEIISAAEKSKSEIDLEQNLQRKFEHYFPPASWGNENFQIRYSIAQEFIEVYRKPNPQGGSAEVSLKYSAFYTNEFNALKTTIQKQKERLAEQDIQFSLLSRFDVLHDIRHSFLQSLTEKLAEVTTFSQLYIPAGRSFFANLKSSIFTFLSENNAVDPFLVEFGTYYENIKSPITREKLIRSIINIELRNEIADLNHKILCGKYVQEDGEDYLVMDGERKISVADSSSGQQETLPLAIILGTIAFFKPQIGGNSIYIEEPEAHIFPAAQRDIVELIATIYNSQKDNLQFLLTTHSPYILTAFNNLLQAGILAINASEEKIKDISRYVPVSRFLDPNELSVYSLSDGYCQSILDAETGLIDTNIIDEVSNELAIQFDQLLDLEP
ncbi:MAG: ATP-binding protein [Symploca sp. SIO1B1]|nr:ATP-binding protein [Symploca sp. SIO1B1]